VLVRRITLRVGGEPFVAVSVGRRNRTFTPWVTERHGEVSDAGSGHPVSTQRMTAFDDEHDAQRDDSEHGER